MTSTPSTQPAPCAATFSGGYALARAEVDQCLARLRAPSDTSPRSAGLVDELVERFGAGGAEAILVVYDIEKEYLGRLARALGPHRSAAVLCEMRRQAAEALTGEDER